MMLLSQAQNLERIHEFHVVLAQSGLMKWCTVPYSFLAMTKPSEYSDESRLEVRPAHGKYLFVYPFVKTRAWYALPADERWRIMQEHIKVGREYPSVDLNTSYSFGLDDQEFVVAFETDNPADFLDLVQRLRTTESSSYTLRDTPTFTCISCSVERALGALDGAALSTALSGAALNKRDAAAVEHLRAADPVLRKLIDAVGVDGLRDRRRVPVPRPLRGACALDRRPAAVDQGGARDLRAADRSLRRPPADARGGARGRPRRTAHRGRAVARQGAYLRSLAEHVLDGSLELDKLGRLPDERGDRRADAVKGIGEWSSHMFLMFDLGRPDVLAVGDLGIRRAVMVRYGSPELPDAAEMERIGGAVASVSDAGVPVPVAVATGDAGLGGLCLAGREGVALLSPARWRC